MTEKFIYEALAEEFDVPCNFSPLDEIMFKYEQSWCEKHCGKASEAECWERFFKCKKKLQKNGGRQMTLDEENIKAEQRSIEYQTDLEVARYELQLAANALEYCKSIFEQIAKITKVDTLQNQLCVNAIGYLNEFLAAEK